MKFEVGDAVRVKGGSPYWSGRSGVVARVTPESSFRWDYIVSFDTSNASFYSYELELDTRFSTPASETQTISVITARTADDVVVGGDSDFDDFDDLVSQIQRNPNLVIKTSYGRVIFGRHVITVERVR